MELHEYARCDAVGLRELIVAGEVTAAEVEAVARQALELANETVNGLALPLFEQALDYSADGPLAGVPFLIKDIGPVAKGVPFFCGSRSIPGPLAQNDTHLMARARAAGLATLGLTTAPEMAISFATESLKYGITRNPWDLERGVGGSSGGAAALVAAGAVPVAHATDGAGSVRIPAACCGLVGLKPSRGRTPAGPNTGEAGFGMSYEFALTRTVRDAAHLLDAFQGHHAGDKYTAPPPRRRYADELGRDTGRLRVAVTTSAWSGVAVDAEVVEATVRVGRLLDELGHDVTEASPAVDWDEAMRGLRAQLAALAVPYLTAPRPPDPNKLEAVSRLVLAEARELGALKLMAGLDAQNRVSRSVGAFFTEYDLLVTPTLGQLPAPHGTLQYNDPGHTVTSWLQGLFEYGPFTALFNVSSEPAISLPLGQSASGLPIGVQFVAPYGREDLLFRLAAQLELAAPWKDRVPTNFVGTRSLTP
ncbi:amidase [Solihabitans fulvus]|uniref:Amidase n=1 Tax=Solihabitans fulvus TaxID=1892852 RepID=A0A5B2WWP3_9PSEU|nr:amidase family protein [Solihabitans fulvus]KAA2255925.1 amidase [Solihabitans fulvus]